MESGSGPQSPKPGFGPGSPGYGPGANQEEPRSQEGPQSPPAGPQSPGGGFAPGGPMEQARQGGVPATPEVPQSPAAPQSPGVPQAPQSPGMMQQQPGGWQQPQTPTVAQGELAGWGARLGGYLIDLLILIVPTIILVVIGGAVISTSEGGGAAVILLGVLAFFVATLLYAPVLMARGGEKNGQTVGRQVVGIRVVRDNGQQFGFGSALVREFVVKGLLFGTAGSLLFSIPTIVDYLWPLWDDENRTLHDMVVSTHVVRA